VRDRVVFGGIMDISGKSLSTLETVTLWNKRIPYRAALRG